jgi:hypothetical protein
VDKTERMSAAQYRAGAAKVPTEAQECKWLFEWAQMQSSRGWKLSDILVHVPNGAYHGADRKAGAVVARKLREQGLHPGAFDYILPVPVLRSGLRFCPGLWLEMKRTRGGTVSEDQKKFMSSMQQLGWQCEIAKGWIQATRIIEAYLDPASGVKR